MTPFILSGTTTYTWNARNQLASIAGTAGNATFKYDGLGRRIEKTINGDTTGFLYDGAQAIAELRGSALDTEYHTGLAIDEVLARYGSSGNRTLLTDALMSVIAQANDDQSVGNFYAYSAFGQAITLGPDGGNSLQYTGRENDGTGLYYYRARYYDPVLKQFMSEDPIGIRGGINPRSYVRGNPISFSDPLGLEVTLYSRPINLTGSYEFLNDKGIEHYWIRTDTYESGMGPAGGGVPAQNQPPDELFGPTSTNDHSGQSGRSNATRIPIPFPVDEQCVNELITPGRNLGPFIPLVNDCQRFAENVLSRCRIPPPWNSARNPNFPRLPRLNVTRQ